MGSIVNNFGVSGIGIPETCYPKLKMNEPYVAKV
jgi:hypothetical protein